MKRARRLFLPAALAALAGACVVNVDEMDKTDASPLAGSEERLVTLALSVPGPPASRAALDEEAENEVKTVDVLLFKTDDHYFRYRAIGSTPENDGDNAHKTFTVRLPEGTWNIVVLANAREAFTNTAYAHKDLLAPATLAKTDVSRVDVLNGLVLQLADKTSTWPEGTYAGIPMWGYHDGLAIGPDAAAPTANVMLTRSLARVNVTVSDDKGARDVFELDSVLLYNYSRAGRLAPLAVTGGGYGSAWDVSQTKAVAASLPGLSLLADAVTPLEVRGPLGYDVPTGGEYAYKFTNEIYTFEAASGASGTLPVNTCLVIGGKYQGGSAPLYYRVDFIDKDDNYLALLRNHSYNVEIQEVTGEGYPTPWGAYNNTPANIKATVLAWDDAAIENIVFDGKNYLGITPAEFFLRGQARNGNRITISTDVASGWTATVTNSPGEGGTKPAWISNPSGTFTGAGKKDLLTFDVTANGSGVDRVAYIHVAAGRLDFVVKVTQRVASASAVWVTDENNLYDLPELVFETVAGEQPAAQKLLLHWIPQGETVTVSTSPDLSGNGPFKYDTGSDEPGTTLLSITDASGTKLLEILPPALTAGEMVTNPFIERASTVRFTMIHDDVPSVADVSLRHVNYLTTTDASVYPLDGSVCSFTVKSNTAWEISVADPEGILDPASRAALHGLSGGYHPAGEQLSFQLVDDVEELKDGKVATLTFTDPTGHMTPVIATITGVVCGMNGIAATKQIGENRYKTHMYGNKCWMVENSMEGLDGQIAQKYHGTDPTHVNGYYYTYDNAKYACPTGWHIPTAAEADALISMLTSSHASTTGKWWHGTSGKVNNAFAGYRNNSGWVYWESYAAWWKNSDTYEVIMGNTSNAGLSKGVFSPSGPPLTTVRCVQTL
jgi:uncharacterized protein (TIGR02145 family)